MSAGRKKLPLLLLILVSCGSPLTAQERTPQQQAEVERLQGGIEDFFKGFNDDPDKLPIDQHELLALCAPRPVLYTNAAEDLWANPSGQFDMMTIGGKLAR